MKSQTRDLSNGILRRAAITSLGHFVPERVVDSLELDRSLGLPDGWTEGRTGIRRRRVSSGATSDLLAGAASQCLAAADVDPASIDCLIAATSTPDHFMPPTAAILQRKVGCSRAWGFDVSAACSGFTHALVVATSLIESGGARRVLVAAGDQMSSFIDGDDQNTAILFGDGAGAALIEVSDDESHGIQDHVCVMDGDGADLLRIPAGGTALPASIETVKARSHTVEMNGRAVFGAAVRTMSQLTRTILERNGLVADDIDWLVPHQANARIISAIAKDVSIPLDRVAMNIAEYGNTTAATIPLCLSELHSAGRLARGDRVVLVSFGAGFTAAAVYLRWAMAPALPKAWPVEAGSVSGFSFSNRVVSVAPLGTSSARGFSDA